MMERKYSFLRDKYYELLLPTMFMVMSEKIAVVIDVVLIGLILGGSELAPVNSISPLLYFTGIFYILFGQGGSLLALRAKYGFPHWNHCDFIDLYCVNIRVFRQYSALVKHSSKRLLSG